MTNAGLLIGFFAILFLPLHRMRLLGSLVALGALQIGADLEAMATLTSKEQGLPEPRQALVGGMMMGAAIGYFAGWIRSAWFRRTPSDVETPEQPAQNQVNEPSESDNPSR